MPVVDNVASNYMGGRYRLLARNQHDRKRRFANQIAAIRRRTVSSIARRFCEDDKKRAKREAGYLHPSIDQDRRDLMLLGTYNAFTRLKPYVPHALHYHDSHIRFLNKRL